MRQSFVALMEGALVIGIIVLGLGMVMLGALALVLMKFIPYGIGIGIVLNLFGMIDVSWWNILFWPVVVYIMLWTITILSAASADRAAGRRGRR